MGETTELTLPDGTKIGAYKASPSGAAKGSIVVVQEIFGVNPHIRSVADRFAAEGYVALAPALFDLSGETGVELAYDPAGMKRGMAIASALDRAHLVAACAAAVTALAATGPVAIVGFCLGGTLAYAAAARDARLAAAVCYYGGGIAAMAGAKLHCPVLMHFGEKDDHIRATDVDKIRAAHPEATIYTYPAGHGFNCDVRASYDAPSADEAWPRTLGFLADTL